MGSNELSDSRIRWVIEELEVLLNEDSSKLTLSDLAGRLNLSVSRLRHLFRDEVGVSPGRYHKLLRLKRLRNLLVQSNLCVKEAIAASGFSDFSHTVRDYKAFFGLSPHQTIRLSRNLNQAIAGRRACTVSNGGQGNRAKESAPCGAATSANE